MKVFVDVIDKMNKELPDEIKKYGYVIGPITLVGELMGVSKALMATIENPDLVKKMLEFSVEVISEYANAQFNAEEILKKIDNKPLVLHICGDTKHLVKGMCETGTVRLSLDTPMNFKELKKEIPKGISLIGNIDPVKVMLQGTVGEVKKDTRRLLEEMKDAENFILSTGCDIAVETPLENIDAFMEAGK
ncbi:MAG: hypothetical protein FH753_00580 [Firmicutes bacterium]|nr:hypothetical protein [Bacillota bacterium]